MGPASYLQHFGSHLPVLGYFYSVFDLFSLPWVGSSSNTSPCSAEIFFLWLLWLLHAHCFARAVVSKTFTAQACDCHAEGSVLLQDVGLIRQSV